MNKKLNWRFILSLIGFLLIGISMIFPKETWLIVSGALLFVVGMVKKPKRGRKNK